MKKIIVVGILAILIAVSVVSIIIAAEKNNGFKEGVIVCTPDPITGEVPVVVVQSYETPSFFEIAKEKLGIEYIGKADIVIRFETYTETMAAFNRIHHSFDIASVRDEELIFGFNDMSEMGYSYKIDWKEGGIYHWEYRLDASITECPAILYVYRNGVLYDKVSISIAAVETGNGMIRKEIVSCESKKLNVVYYNFDTQKP